MCRSIPWRVAVLAVSIFTMSSTANAQTQTKVSGLIHAYTPALDAFGPWQIVGEWCLTVNSASGNVDFVALLSMARSENSMREPHTHHLTLTDGQMTALPNGFRISGAASITSNGNPAGFSGSPIEIDITGGSAVPFASVALTFGGAAATHFGTQPLKGVVTPR